MAELSVEITGKIDKLEKALENAKKDLSNFEKTSDKVGKGISKNNIRTGKSFNNLSKGAVSGTSAMTAFSRTIQDAPFGIMGVSNNITNLTEQFGYLKNKTGSAKGALSAMLRDLKGFGGISLLISVATSAMLVFGDKIFKTKNKVKSLREEQEKLEKSLEDYAFSLDSVSKAMLKGLQNSAKEITTLKLLKSRIEDTTLSIDERKKSINQLRQIYPDYLKGFSDEKIINGGLKTVYDDLTDSIIKRAKATAALNQIVKNSSKVLNLESQIESKQEEIKGKKLSLENANTIALARAGKERAGSNFSVQTAIKLQKELNALTSEENKLLAQKTEIETKNTKLESKINDLGGVPTTKVPVTIDPVVKVPKETASTLIPGLQESLTQGIQGLNASIPEIKIPKVNKQPFVDSLTEMDIAAKQIIGTSIASTFSQLGEAIGTGTANATQVIISGMGSLLSAMGDKLIQLGTAAVLAGTITQLFGSIAGIGAGFAAIAGGVALKAFGSSVSSFQGAGESGVSSNTSTYSGVSSSSGFSSSSGGLQNVVFEIAGSKLVGVISNELRRNKNLGGDFSFT